MYKFLVSILFITIIFTGCATQQQKVDIEPQQIYNTYKKVENSPNDTHTLYLDYYLDEERNKVLNLLKLGLYSYQQGYYKDSKIVFDKVLNNIESLNVDNEMSDKVKSLWHDESSKLFVGEPYERVMAYYYRGLLYLKDKDYENARASFKGGLLQDSKVENENYQADFRTLILLEALSSRLNGDIELCETSLKELENIKIQNFNISNNERYEDKSNEEIKELQKKIVQSAHTTYELNQSNINTKNVFLLIDSGDSPRKYTTGKGNSELAFSKPYNSSIPKITVNGKEKKILLLDDIYYQATTRGGREIDKIIQGKVAWKDEAVQTSQDFDKLSTGSWKATTSILENYDSSGNSNADGLVAGVALIFAAIAGTAKVASEIAEATSEAVQTSADARYWSNLPGKIYLYMDKLPEGNYTIQIGENAKKSLNIVIKKNDIVVEHINSDDIIKPSGLVTNAMIEDVLNEKEKYEAKYLQEVKQNKGDNNETISSKFNGFFNSIKF